MKRPYLYMLLVILMTNLSVFANKVDSLEQYVLEAKGSEKIDAILKLGGEYQYTDYVKSLKYAEDALFMSKKMNYKLGIAKAKNNIGYSLTDLGKYSRAIKNYEEAIELFQELGEKNDEAIAYNDIGYIYQLQGLIEKAINYYIKSLKILETLDDKKSEAACLNNIGLLYHDQKNHEKALEYYLKSLETKKGLPGNEASIALSLNNIGSVYFSQGDYIKAKEYFFESLFKRKKMDDKKGIAQSLTNIAGLFREQKKYDTAHEYLNQAEEIQREINDPSGLTNSLVQIGVIYKFKNEYNNARSYLEEAYKLSHETGSVSQIQSTSLALSGIYRKTGKYEEAYTLLLEHKEMSDSLMNTENTRKLTRAGLQYEFEKKLHEHELEQIQKNHEFEIEMKEQKIISYSFAIGAGALIILTIVILKSLNDKKKANLRITQQKKEIEDKSFKLQEALENITDSVRYAKRIQQALLQAEEHTTEHFPAHFILFKPKDIISGDFYWSYEKDDNVYIAAVDCTGHGVPGALMCMLGISFLNSINAEFDDLSPAEILNKLRDKVVQELNQTGKDWSSRDGMDMSIAKINIKTNQLDWAGANNPLVLIQNNELLEIKADRQAINYNEDPQPFTNHTLNLNKGDSLYMFSDGYADQFGGPKGKKFKYASLKKLLHSVVSKPVEEQKKILDDTFMNWKGDLEQIDDVCVIGLQV